MARGARMRPGLRFGLLGSTALLHVALVAAPSLAQAPDARPTGGEVIAGQAIIGQDAARTVVTQGSQRAVVDWQRFDVGRDHTVRFEQPNAQAWTLNRVRTPDPSLIAGRIEANGGVAIVNPSGILFADGAQVDVGALIASAPGITTENFMAGRMRFDQRANPGARVENRGRITVREQGLAVLAGPRVANNGIIEARLGRVGLAGAETYTLDLAGDGLISIDVTGAVRQAPDGTMALVTNDGVIIAEGGSIRITAEAASGLVETLVANRGRLDVGAPGTGGEVRVTAQGGDIRLDGTVIATGGTGRGGRIAANGSGRVTVGAGARLDASGGAGGGTILVGTEGIGPAHVLAAQIVLEQGAVLRADATGRGDGGTIALNSRERTELAGEVTARGGPEGGDGGFVELSGQGVVRIALSLDLSAPAGRAGTLLLDPDSIRVVASLDPATTPPAGDPRIFTADTDPAGFLLIDAASVNAAGVGTVVLQAKNAIEFAAAVNRGTGTLQLQADGTITQSAGATITAGTLVIRGFDGGDAAAGAVTLTQANAVGKLDAVSKGALAFTAAGDLDVLGAAGTAVTLTTPGALTLSGPVDAGTGAVSLRADGAITQAAAGLVTAGTLVIRAADGTAGAAAVTLTEPNAVGKLDAISKAALTFAAESDLDVARAQGTAVTLATPGTLALSGPVNAGTGTATLRADGAITQAAAGLVTAGTLVIRGAAGDDAAAGAVTLTKANAVSKLDAISNGTLQLAGSGALAVERAEAAALTITTAGALTVSGPVTASDGALKLTGNSVTIGKAVAATAKDSLLELTTTAAGATLTITADGTLAVGEGGTIRLTADAMALGGAVTAPGGTIAIDRRAASTGLIDLGKTGAQAGELRLDAAELALLSGARLELGRATGGPTIQITEALTISAVAEVRLQTSTLTISKLASLVLPTGGLLDIRADTVALPQLGDGTRLSVPGGTIAITPRSADRAVTVGATEAGRLSLDAGLLERIGDAANPTARLVITAAGNQPVTLGGDVKLSAADGTGVRVQTLRLLAPGGAVTQSAGVLAVPNVEVEAGTEVALTRSGNAFARLSGSAGTKLAALSVGALTLGDVTAPAITVTGAAITLDGLIATASATLTATGAAPTAGFIVQTAKGLIGAADATVALDLKATGAITLDAAGQNRLSSLVLDGAAGQQQAILSVTGLAVRGQGGDVTLTAPDIAFTKAFTAAGDLTLAATGTEGAGGGIAQSAALGVGGTLAATALRAILLDTATNNIGGLGHITAGTGTALAAERRIAIRSAAPTVALDGKLSVPAGGSILLAVDSLTLGAGGQISAPGGTVFLAPNSNDRHVALGRREPDDLPATPPGASGELRLSATLLTGRTTASRLDIGRLSDGTVTAGSIRHYGADLGLGGFDTVALAATGFIRQRGLTLAEAEGDGPGGADGRRGALTVQALELRAGGDIWLGADNAIGSLSVAKAGGAFVLRQAPGLALGITGPADASGRMTLIADSLAFGKEARLSVPGGTIELLPRTQGRDISLGSTAPSGLSLTTEALAQLGDADAPTGALRLGASSDPAAAGLSGWAKDFSIGLTEAGLPGGGRTAGVIRLGSPVALRPRIGGLDLVGAAVDQASGAALDVARLSVDSFGGVILTAPGNRVDRLAAAAGGGTAVRAGRLAGSEDDAVFRFVAGGTTPLVIDGDIVALYAPGGADPATGGRIDIVAPSLDIRADLTTSLPGGGILAADTVRTDTGLIRLQATADGIMQQDGTAITAARLAALAEGAIELGSTGNLILSLVPIGTLLPDGTFAAEPGAALLARGGDITLATRLNPAAGLAAAERALVVDGDIRVPTGLITGRIADAGAIEAGGVAAGDFLGTGTGFRIRLVADDMALRADLVAPGGEVVLDQAGTTPGWGGVRLRPRANADEQGLFLDGAELGRLVLTGAAVAPGVDPLGIAGGGRITLSASGDFLLTESLILPGIGELRLEAPDGSIIQQAGTIEVRALSAFARDSITLDLPGNAVARLRDIHALTGDVTLRIGSIPAFGGDAAPAALLAPGRDALDAPTGEGAALRITGTSVNRGIEAGAGRTITLVADDLDIRAPLLAPGGAVRLLPLTAGRHIRLGSAAQGLPALQMYLSAAELARVDVGADGRLAIGATGATPAGLLTFGDQTLDFGRAADGVQTVGRLDLAASIAIEQTGGALRVEDLTLTLDTANRRPVFFEFFPGLVFPIPDTSPARIALGGENAIGRVLGATLRVDPAFPGTGNGHNTILLRQASGEALGIAGDVTLSDPAGRITLVADALAIGADVSAPGAGRIEILPRSAGTPITLGTATGGLHLPADALARLSTGDGVLRLGRSADPLAAGLTAGGIALGGALDFTGIAAQLELYAGMQGATPGGITQTGALTVARLAGEAAGGIVLDDPANRIGRLAQRDVIAGGDGGQSLRAGTATADAPLAVATAEPTLRVDAAVQAGTAGGRLTLRADDMAIAAPLRAPGGTVHLAPLTEDGTQAVRLGSAGSGGALHLSAEELRRAEATTLEIGLAGGTPGSGSGPLTLEADIDLRDAPGGATPFANWRVRELRIATGIAADGTAQDATQTAGRLNVEALSGDVAGSVLLAAAGNPINTVRGLSAGGDVALRFGGVADGAGGVLPPALDTSGNPVAGTTAPVITADAARQGAAADQFGLRAGAGRDVQITADSLVITPITGAGAPATLQAPGGTVRLSAASAGRFILLGATFPGTLSLSTETLAAIGGSGEGGTTNPVERLRIGGTGPIIVGGPVELREPSLPDGTPGAERVRVLELASGNVIVGDGTIRAGGFAATATAIELTAAHAIERLAPRTDDTGAALSGGLVAAGGALRFGSGRPFTIGEDVLALGDVTLFGTADVTLAPGARVESGGELRLEAGGSLTLEGGLAAQGPMRLSALGDGAVLAILGGPVEAGGTLFLLAPQGSVTQGEDGRILAGRLDASAGMGILLDAADNTVTVVERAESAEGDVRIRVLGTLQIAGVVGAGGDVVLEAGSDLSLPGVTVTGGSLRLDSGGFATLADARLTATAGDIIASGATGLTADGAALAATGEVRLTSGAALTLLRTTVTADGRIELQADGALTLGGTSLDGVSLLLIAGGALGVTDGTLTAADSISIETTGGDLSLPGTTITGGSLDLVADGAAALAGARLTATDGDLAATGGMGLTADGAALAATGEIRLTSGAALTLLRTTVTADGRVELIADGALTLGATTLDGASLLLVAGGALGVTDGMLTAAGGIRIETTGGDLSLPGTTVTGGSVDLVADGGAALAAARLTATAGDLAAAAGTELTADGAVLAAAGDIRLTSGAALTLLRATLTADGRIELHADGAMTLGAGSLGAAAIVARAGGPLAVTDTTLTALDSLRLEATGGDLAASGLTLSAEDAELVAGGAATLGTLAATIERAMLITAPGGITMSSPGTLRPRGTALPIILFDTRTGGFTAIPDVAAPDTAGAPAAAADDAGAAPGHRRRCAHLRPVTRRPGGQRAARA